jgi:hypothetical protein
LAASAAQLGVGVGVYGGGVAVHVGHGYYRHGRWFAHRRWNGAAWFHF